MTSRGRLTFIVVALLLVGRATRSQQAIPRTWDEHELERFEVPLVHAAASPKHAAPDYYYRIPIRPIYKSYPIYAPGHEPPDYLAWLEAQEPEVLFEDSKLRSDAEWIAAGELVFDGPIGFGASFTISQVRDRSWYDRHSVPVTNDGIMPFSRYVIRRKGVVEVGSGACLMCHARVMPDGSLLKGAQGNFPVDRILAANMRLQAERSGDSRALLESIRIGQRTFFSVPWLQPDPAARISKMSLEEIAAAYAAIPPGVSTRVNLNVFTPAQIPDLIGVADLKHLDHTGVVLQRSIADLMRYVALVQGANSLDTFGTFALLDPLPNPTSLQRYSDEQLFALGRFVYALKPPPNPNPFDKRAERGRALFRSEGCDLCHTPPLYTSNMLTPVDGFKVPADHFDKYGIIDRSVGTDPDLALRTRKGTGYYKVPSLRGVWYRGPLQHAGAVQNLEEWFDPARRDRVRGHPFGLALTPDDRGALIAFLKTL